MDITLLSRNNNPIVQELDDRNNQVMLLTGALLVVTTFKQHNAKQVVSQYLSWKED